MSEMKRYENSGTDGMGITDHGEWVWFDDAEDAIKAAVEAEREACAMAAEHPFYNVLGNTALAAAIRARGKEPEHE
jgi:phosphopantothenate synthetase